MVLRTRPLCLLCGSVLLSGLLTASSGIPADNQPDQPNQAAPKAPALVDQLGGETRYLTHVATDKPIYKPAETVYVRGVVLNAADHTPLPASTPGMGTVEVIGPKGDTVAQGWGASEDSVLAFQWKIPENTPGGQYTVKVTHSGSGAPPAERKIDVRVYRAPRLKSQIVFVRDGYGPGDEVTALLHVERAEGGFPADAPVTAIARVDGAEVFRGPSMVDASGNCRVSFQLPESIERGEGTLALVIEDGGVVETASKTIPILLQTVDLKLYPEGGDLVAGLNNRVYFEAKTPAQKPADLAGVVIDDQGKEIAHFRSEHEGRGRFEFTPQAGRTYSLKISEPSGIRTTYPLPEAKSEGVVLSAASEVVEPGQPVKLRLSGNSDRTVTVTIKKRERELASSEVNIKQGEVATATLNLPETADGVLIATAWEADGKPLAERLIFRQPKEAVHVQISADRERYVPGGKVQLKVRTTNRAGEPLPAVVGLTVTDDSVLEMIEKREQAPRLPVTVLLESDVQELADAHVYLDPDNPKASSAVDLLLGTQGWRRFAFVDAVKFMAEHGDKAKRVLAWRQPYMVRTLGAVPMMRGAELRRKAAARFADGVVEKAAANENVAPAPPPGPPQAAHAAQDEKNKGQDAAPRAAAPPQSKAPGREAQLQQFGRPQPDALEQAAKQADGRRRQREFLAAGDRASNLQNIAAIRVYAHAARPDRQPGQRIDFTETLYWNAGVKTDEKTGEATLSFDLSDAVTSFRVTADAFSPGGALGAGSTLVESVEPFYTEPKLPLEVTAGDRITLPLMVVNSTLDPLSQAALNLEAKGLATIGVDPFELPADTRLRRLITLETGAFVGSTDVVLSAVAGPYADSVTRKLVVKPAGFPIHIAASGMLRPGETQSHKIVIPHQVIAGSLDATAKVFPTPMGNLTAALERLIREPYGCFEQTSSSTYPLVMAQQYFKSHSNVDPKLVERSNDMLAKGYDRLIGFECKQGGYEWFGQDPGHEALTAYGLMEFADMAQVREVDAAMLERTRKWLLGQRDGKGGFKRERRALHTWLADPGVSNAYITWALLSAGEKDLDREIDQVQQSAEASENSYEIALAANCLALAGRREAANKLLDRLIPLQSPSGQIEKATQSIVGSGGDALVIEATALATLAWLHDPDYIDFADKGIQFLSESCKDGRYGSTQSTVLALKAIVAYDKAMARPKTPGRIQLIVDGKPVGDPVPFDTNTQGQIALPEFKHLLTPGEHTVAVQMIDGSSMPHMVSVNLNTLKPASDDKCQIGLDVALADVKLQEGGITEARVKVSNRSDETVPMPIAIIGLPGGLEPRHDQLKELVKSGAIAAYEVLGREVVLYWRAMEPKAELELPISVTAAIPGRYTGPASRAYLYYTDELKTWNDGLQVEITPLAQ